MSKTISHEAAQIVHALASLPGGQAVDVVSRRFARFGFAEAGTGYRQDKQAFTPAEAPEELNIPPEPDEVVITLKGAVDGDEKANELADDLANLFARCGVCPFWELRASFDQNDGQNGQSYKLTIFTQPTAPTADDWA